MDTGTATFNFGTSTCGPYTEPIGFYSIVRCKAVPAIASVGPLFSGTSKLVQAGAAITIQGTGFGTGQCATCRVTASNPQSTALQISSWSNTSIQAFLPASFSGISQIAVTAASGVDAINIMAAVNETPLINGVTNSATGLPGAIAPGELISIYGSNLGPSTGISFSVDPTAGMVDTTLGGTQVLFGSFAAPITYASSTQINAVVPYEVAGQSQITMQIEYGGSSASQNLQVASASPGVYTSNFSGSGPVVAANQDGSINSSSNPAAKGSYVTVYFTGGGQTNPPAITGAVNPSAPLKYLVQQPTVTVGGAAAAVSFAGSAPALIDGVDQLDIQLAADTPSGAQPLVITMGAVSSPSTATLAVQ
ncbi:MAG TPA: IPT/TIG domain-containing protein [Bryobacteraceae bacterium]|nr:IPT/TIG domain-containing protein [Bryobacteraceae bacterium]